MSNVIDFGNSREDNALYDVAWLLRTWRRRSFIVHDCLSFSVWLFIVRNMARTESSLTVAARREHEKALLATYYESLVAAVPSNHPPNTEVPGGCG